MGVSTYAVMLCLLVGAAVAAASEATAHCCVGRVDVHACAFMCACIVLGLHRLGMFKCTLRLCV